jgi:hypothetical protein
MHMQRALLPARASLVAMGDRNTIAVPAAAQLPRQNALHGETTGSAPPRARCCALRLQRETLRPHARRPQGERDV